jgi:hypothetical protein
MTVETLKKVRRLCILAQNAAALGEGGSERRWKRAEAAYAKLLREIEDEACPSHDWKPFAGALRKCRVCESRRLVRLISTKQFSPGGAL